MGKLSNALSAKKLIQRWLGIEAIKNDITSKYIEAQSDFSDAFSAIEGVYQNHEQIESVYERAMEYRNHFLMIEDHGLEIYIGKDNVTELADRSWGLLSGYQYIFGFAFEEDQLADDFSDYLYLVPGEAVQEAVQWTGYDWHLVGKCHITNGNNCPEPRLLSGTAVWKLLRNHPKDNNAALLFSFPAVEEYLQTGRSFMREGIMQTQSITQLDVPWNAKYGYIVSGVATITRRKAPGKQLA